MRIRRSKRSVAQIDLPPIWRGGHRFLPRGFRVITVNRKSPRRDVERHWQGGPPLHKNAKCVTCGKSLQLIWDIDLTAPELASVRQLLEGVSRVPLYYCMWCPAANVYQFQDDSRLRCFDPGNHNGSGETSPFTDFPPVLPRKAIRLEPIPSAIEGLLTLEDEVGLEALDPEGRRVLNEYFRKEIESTWDLPFSQFGGQPLLVQSHWEIVCPNSKCPAHLIEHPYPERERRFLMKELAVVEDDVDLANQEFFAQIAYHICCVCRTIHAQYRCS